jgi:putative phosphoribosyl transferase
MTTRTGIRLVFQSSRGVELAGELVMPDSAGSHPVVVFAPGRDSDGTTPRHQALAEHLAAEGIAAFLFDVTGHDESAGTATDDTEARQVDDLRAAIAVLGALDDLDTRRVGVLGVDSGAVAALQCAARTPAIRALVLQSTKAGGAGDAVSRVTVPTLLVVSEDDEPILGWFSRHLA